MKDVHDQPTTRRSGSHRLALEDLLHGLDLAADLVQVAGGGAVGVAVLSEEVAHLDGELAGALDAETATVAAILELAAVPASSLDQAVELVELGLELFQALGLAHRAPPNGRVVGLPRRATVAKL